MDRRQILIALGALAAAPAAVAAPAIDPEGARKIGQAYLAARPGLDAKRLAAEVPPGGWTPEKLATLRGKVAADFRAGRVFVHRGWRLSETEGRLCAALAAVA